MDFHPASTVFPMLSEAELKVLAEDIRVNGQLEPVITVGGLVLDGRNRLAACKIAGVEPKITEAESVPALKCALTDPWAFVVSRNLHRRHLDASQRAMIASKIANMCREDTLKRGPVASKEASEKKSESEAAKMLNVSRSSVQRARKVREHGSPELVAKVEAGELSVNAAAKQVSEREVSVPPSQADSEEQAQNVKGKDGVDEGVGMDDVSVEVEDREVRAEQNKSVKEALAQIEQVRSLLETTKKTYGISPKNKKRLQEAVLGIVAVITRE